MKAKIAILRRFIQRRAGIGDRFWKPTQRGEHMAPRRAPARDMRGEAEGVGKRRDRAGGIAAPGQKMAALDMKLVIERVFVRERRRQRPGLRPFSLPLPMPGEQAEPGCVLRLQRHRAFIGGFRRRDLAYAGEQIAEMGKSLGLTRVARNRLPCRLQRLGERALGDENMAEQGPGAIRRRMGGEPGAQPRDRLAPLPRLRREIVADGKILAPFIAEIAGDELGEGEIAIEPELVTRGLVRPGEAEMRGETRMHRKPVLGKGTAADDVGEAGDQMGRHAEARETILRHMEKNPHIGMVGGEENRLLAEIPFHQLGDREAGFLVPLALQRQIHLESTIQSHFLIDVEVEIARSRFLRWHPVSHQPVEIGITELDRIGARFQKFRPRIARMRLIGKGPEEIAVDIGHRDHRFIEAEIGEIDPLREIENQIDDDIGAVQGRTARRVDIVIGGDMESALAGIGGNVLIEGVHQRIRLTIADEDDAPHSRPRLTYAVSLPVFWRNFIIFCMAFSVVSLA